MCSMLQVRLLTGKHPPHPQPSMTTGRLVTTWTPSCSSSARWPGRGMSFVSVWRWHRPGPPSTTAGANPSRLPNYCCCCHVFVSPSPFFSHEPVWCEYRCVFCLNKIWQNLEKAIAPHLRFIAFRAAEFTTGNIYSLLSSVLMPHWDWLLN